MKKNSKILIFTILNSYFLISCDSNYANNEHLLDKKETMFTSHLTISSTGLSEKEFLGKIIFNDKNLSEPRGQSCSSCHDPSNAYAANKQNMLNGMSFGANKEIFGKRNAPTIMYLKNLPDLHLELNEETKEFDYIGGAFLDGSAKNLEEQVFGPLLSKLEMNNGTKENIINKIKNDGYEDKFKKIYGSKSLDSTDSAVKNIQDAIVAYEKSIELNKFTSKFDYFVKGKVNLSDSEKRGFDLFKDKNKGNCAACHVIEEDKNKNSIFTDFSYDNLGVPKNTKSPFYKMKKNFNKDESFFIDKGLGETEKINDKKHFGRFRTPTLRNIELTAPYMHNGVFETLEEVVKFYNTACEPDNPDKFDPPEIEENRNCDEIGKLKLSKEEINDIVNFLKTLTDNYEIK
ncbi:MAG: cytochrome c peroxidase [Candidatus Sericytochromatia bacterium]